MMDRDSIRSQRSLKSARNSHKSTCSSIIYEGKKRFHLSNTSSIVQDKVNCKRDKLLRFHA